MSATFLTIKKFIGSRGTSLIEAILYIVLLMMVMGAVVQILISIGGVYREIKVTRELESSGTIVMESMLREIRNASSVDLSGSTLGTNSGVLVLLGVDESLNPYSVTFSTSSDVVVISRDGGAPEALTSLSGKVNSLIFTRVATSTSEGVRIELELSGLSESNPKSEKFYGFSVLRGSY